MTVACDLSIPRRRAGPLPDLADHRRTQQSSLIHAASLPPKDVARPDGKDSLFVFTPISTAAFAKHKNSLSKGRTFTGRHKEIGRSEGACLSKFSKCFACPRRDVSDVIEGYKPMSNVGPKRAG